MVATINHDYVGKLEDTPSAHVECVTCHHGITQPRTLNGVLSDAIETQGIDAGVKLYHDLRSQYYGTGAYDFGESPLNQLAESLLARHKTKEAVAIMEMNFAANNPQSVWAFPHPRDVAPGKWGNGEGYRRFPQSGRVASRRHLGETTDRFTFWREKRVTRASVNSISSALVAAGQARIVERPDIFPNSRSHRKADPENPNGEAS